MIHLTQHNRPHVSLPAGLPASLPASLPACPPAPALHHVILKGWISVFSSLSCAVVLVPVPELSLYWLSVCVCVLPCDRYVCVVRSILNLFRIAVPLIGSAVVRVVRVCGHWADVLNLSGTHNYLRSSARCNVFVSDSLCDLLSLPRVPYM